MKKETELLIKKLMEKLKKVKNKRQQKKIKKRINDLMWGE